MNIKSVGITSQVFLRLIGVLLYQASFYNNITGNFNVVLCDLLLLNVLIVFSASLRRKEHF
jgi:hypothetical protein